MDGNAGERRPKPPVKPIYRILVLLLVVAIVGVAMWHVVTR